MHSPSPSTKTATKFSAAVAVLALLLSSVGVGSASAAPGPPPPDELSEPASPVGPIDLPTLSPSVDVTVDLDCARPEPIEVHIDNSTTSNQFADITVNSGTTVSLLVAAQSLANYPIASSYGETVDVSVSSSDGQVDKTFTDDCASEPSYSIATTCNPDGAEVTVANSGNAIAYFDVTNDTTSLSQSPEVAPNGSATVFFAVPDGETHDFSISHNGSLFATESVNVDCAVPAPTPSPTPTPAPPAVEDPEPAPEANEGDEVPTTEERAETVSQDADEAADNDVEDVADDVEIVAAGPEVSTAGRTQRSALMLWLTGALALVVFAALASLRKSRDY